MTEPTILALGTSPRGDLLLRRRTIDDVPVTELVVNGVFAMDSTETSSERALAALVPAGAQRVLVGGLGLGYTAAAVMEREGLALARLDVVELEPLLVAWAREGRTPVLAAVAADARVRLQVADMAEVLRGDAEPLGPWDAVLLDVDNGPDFLIHDANADLYGAELLAQAYSRLTPGGLLAVWCQGPALDLLATLARLGPAGEHHYEVAREGRDLTYVVYTLAQPLTGSGQNGSHG